jgi:hypothetical protein
MTTLLENFVINHPDITLSHMDYGQHFHLGCGVNISSSPTPCVQSFVENEGSPYRFIIVGELMSFRVVEGAVHFLSSFRQNHIILTPLDLPVWTLYVS